MSGVNPSNPSGHVFFPRTDRKIRRDVDASGYRRKMKTSDKFYIRSHATLVSWTKPVELVIGTLCFIAAPGLTWVQSRFVTRLVQERFTHSAGGTTTERVRMITGSSLAWFGRPKGKVLAPNEVLVRMIATQSRSL